MAAENIAVLTSNGSQLQKLRAARRSTFEILLGKRDKEQLFQRRTLLTESPQSIPTSNTSLKSNKRASGNCYRRSNVVDRFRTFPLTFISIVSLVRSNKEKKRQVFSSLLTTPITVASKPSSKHRHVPLIRNIRTFQV